MTRRCIRRCGSPVLAYFDMCGACSVAERAKRLARNRRNEKTRARRKYISLSAAVYARLDAEAAKRGQSIRSLLAEVLSEV